jgi:hypothetical protein
MHKPTHQKSAKSQHPHAVPTNRMPPRAAPDWQPQPCGLTRLELRQIVEDMLG